MVDADEDMAPTDEVAERIDMVRLGAAAGPGAKVEPAGLAGNDDDAATAPASRWWFSDGGGGGGSRRCFCCTTVASGTSSLSCRSTIDGICDPPVASAGAGTGTGTGTLDCDCG